MKKEFNKRYIILWLAALMVLFVAFGAVFVNALTDVTRPIIISVSPTNNQEDVSIKGVVMVTFSENMDYKTINTDTFTITQRTTPAYGIYRSLAIDGTVEYNNNVATFIPDGKLVPNQEYGNVFTVILSEDIKDVSGNSLSGQYLWSFTTGGDEFNTGTTTSQLNQSTIQNASNESAIYPISNELIVDTIPPTPSTILSATDNDMASSWFSSVWVISGLLLLLLIALISTFVIINASNNKQGSNDGLSRKNPFGDIHPVSAIEGIGPKYSKELHAIGIKNTKQLWNSDAVKVSRKIGASVNLVNSWQNMAELSSVKDIGPQYAELLERSGVHTINQLKNYETNELLNIVREKQDSLKINIQGTSPGTLLVENWIDEARNHKFTESESQTA
ncbi:MAG: DUF4332 domain-containing protein [Candidatus Woesearchaeota archaeon]